MSPSNVYGEFLIGNELASHRDGGQGDWLWGRANRTVLLQSTLRKSLTYMNENISEAVSFPVTASPLDEVDWDQTSTLSNTLIQIENLPYYSRTRGFVIGFVCGNYAESLEYQSVEFGKVLAKKVNRCLIYSLIGTFLCLTLTV